MPLASQFLNYSSLICARGTDRWSCGLDDSTKGRKRRPACGCHVSLSGESDKSVLVLPLLLPSFQHKVVNYVLLCHLRVLFSPCCNKARADSSKSRSTSLAKIFVAKFSEENYGISPLILSFVVDMGCLCTCTRRKKQRCG